MRPTGEIEKVIVWTRRDGGVSICHPAPGGRKVLVRVPKEKKFKEDEQEYDEKVILADRLPTMAGTPHEVLGIEPQHEWLERCRAQSMPADAADVYIMNARDVPEDRTFRNALRCKGIGFVHDMPECREIHRTKMRAARKPILEKMDIDQMRALVAGDAATVAQLEKEKQELRDVTKMEAIEDARTPEDLKKVWKACLDKKVN